MIAPYIDDNNPSIQTRDSIITVTNNLQKFLLAKNKKYGDSALNPTMIFSCDVAEMQIRNRIDDKLSRIKNSDELRKNDVADLTGYLILLMVARDWSNFEDILE